MDDIDIIDIEYMPDIYNNEHYDKTPDIYNLDDFNKKTFGDVVHIKYNNIQNYIEITFNGETIISTDFTIGKMKLLDRHYCIIKLNILKSIQKFNRFNNSRFKMFVISDIDREEDSFSGMYMMSCGTNYDTIFTNDLYIYIKSDINLPSSTWDWQYYKNYHTDIKLISKGPRIKAFMLFSNEQIEPLFWFNLDKMKYIKKYIFDTECGFKMIYNIYKYHNMVFVYLTHLVKDNGEKCLMAWWDKMYGAFLANFDNFYTFVDGDVDEVNKPLNLKAIIGEYKYTFIYEYSI